MKTQKIKLNAIKKKLEKANALPHYSASIGYEIYCAMSDYDLEESIINELKKKYFAFLIKNKHDEIIDVQTNYALNLINSDSKLEYEELHKLFSLADEIFALNQLGLNSNFSKQKEFEVAFKKYLESDGRGKLVAEDKVEKWKKNLWWYKW